MLNAKEIAEKTAEYKSLLWLKAKYMNINSDDRDLLPTVFHQAGSFGINRTDSKDTIETLIKKSAIHAIEGQIKVLEGEFKRMQISLDGITA